MKAPFEVRDIVRITQVSRQYSSCVNGGLCRSNHGCTCANCTASPIVAIFTVLITWLERRGGFWYVGYKPSGLPDSATGAWGTIRINDEPRKFGVTQAEAIGRAPEEQPTPGFGWMVRHPGYDLVH